MVEQQQGMRKTVGEDDQSKSMEAMVVDAVLVGSIEV